MMWDPIEKLLAARDNEKTRITARIVAMVDF
jgi:hypothetical protein